MTKYGALLVLGCLSLAAGFGCGGASQRYHVKGTVTYNGNPVPVGTIQFVPTKDNSGPAGYAKIVNGKFNTADSGNKGTVGGKHTVIINGFDGKSNPDEELPQGKQLFQEYRVTFDVPQQDEPVLQNFKIGAGGV